MLILSSILFKKKMQSNDIALMYCNTSENVVDIFTEPLGKIKFELFREMLGVDASLCRGNHWITL
jgi:hypothetical protein